MVITAIVAVTKLLDLQILHTPSIIMIVYGGSPMHLSTHRLRAKSQNY